MKWNNKSHEFDDVYNNMSQKKGYYLFGAGDYGKQLFSILHSEINIIGFLDNSEYVCQNTVCGKECQNPNLIQKNDELGIIIAMSQFGRVSASQQLDELGYKENIDYFDLELFLCVYYVYKHNLVYFSSISFLPSTVCNLNCKHCLNFNPYSQKTFIRSYEDLISDIDLFFQYVDRIMLFHLSGGEPFLFKYTGDILVYLYERYGDRIDTLRTVTNGTVLPNKDLLEKIAKSKTQVTLDDYREAVPSYKENYDKIKVLFNEYGIDYYENKVDSWIDLGIDVTDYKEKTEEWMINHRSKCSQSSQELRDGKIYSCNYASYAEVADISLPGLNEEYFDLRNNKYNDTVKKELVEFRCGFSNRGFTPFCRKCRGFTSYNNYIVEPAIQVKK